jgi:ATP-dependent exoDNAse (exonuclease V) alpha subunit
LILAKTNAEVAAIGREVRERLRGRDLIVGSDVALDAITSSGHATELLLAAGDRIRFLARNDRLGVVNGSVATVIKIAAVDADLPDTRRRHAIIEARIGERHVRFDTAELADDRGRARIGWAYASTIYGAQGVTVDRAAVLLTPAFDRHDIYVASSRARLETLLVVDRQRLENEMRQAADPSDADISAADRRNWLAGRLSPGRVKETTFDLRNAVIGADRRELRPEQALDERSRNSFAPIRERGKEIGFEL